MIREGSEILEVFRFGFFVYVFHFPYFKILDPYF